MFQVDFGVCVGNYSIVIKSRHLDVRLLPCPGLGALSLAATSTPKWVSEEPGLLCLSSPSSAHHAGAGCPCARLRLGQIHPPSPHLLDVLKCQCTAWPQQLPCQAGEVGGMWAVSESSSEPGCGRVTRGWMPGGRR